MGAPERQLESDLLVVQLVLDEEIDDNEREAFEGMLQALHQGTRTLTERQRSWVRDVCLRVGADVDGVMDKWREGKIPRGREVPTPAVLRNLPLKPPGRR